MQIFGDEIIIIAEDKLIVVFFVFMFHRFLGLRNLEIIGWRFEFNTAPTVVLMIIHDHDIRLAFHV